MTHAEYNDRTSRDSVAGRLEVATTQGEVRLRGLAARYNHERSDLDETILAHCHDARLHYHLRSSRADEPSGGSSQTSVSISPAARPRWNRQVLHGPRDRHGH